MTQQRKVRQSQTVVPFGVGAIFDLNGESLLACDIFRWGPRGERIQSERLAAVLGVTGFRAAPAVASGAWAAPSAGVPYARFPAWLFCQKCRRMTRWTRSMEQADKVPTCGSCPGRKQLAPMRWIQICPNGHMDDLDWRRWAHSKTTAPEALQCQQDNNLFFETVADKGAGGLDSLQVHCHSCHSRRNLLDVTAKGSLKSIGVTCTGKQPWQRWNERTDCDEIPLAVQRGASNVYYPSVHSSIEIPNASRADSQSEKALALKADPFFAPLLGSNDDAPIVTHLIDTLVSSHDVSPEYVRALVKDEKQREAGHATTVEATPGDLLGEEWAAFLTEMDNDDDPDFRTRHVDLVPTTSTEVASLLADRIDRVVLADRLREVRALEGFHRVKPAGKDKLVPAALNHQSSVRWLPAIDVRGEGIFLSLDEQRLSTWEERDTVRHRVAQLERRLDGSFLAPRLRERTGPTLQARYVLLHTLAHLLIRRLAFESGYAATSLRERIYARSSPHHAEGSAKQAGVLIYTAAGDSEGTLGGLVRQGEPPRLQGSVLESLQDAMWCSSDPLCSENLASTFDSLNFAACHACTLVAETSCESGNYLLDRVLVVGSDTVPGYFQSVLNAAVKAAGEGIQGLS